MFFFGICILIALSAVSYRLFSLSYIQHEKYAKEAQSQQSNPALRLSRRGDISVYDISSLKTVPIATTSKVGLDVKRVYSKGPFASQVLGFVGFQGIDRVGQYGVEGYHDDALLDGDIVLTIDPNIQSYVESRLNEVLRKYSSEGGTAIVQDPKTGAILAMASSPSFDPNHYSDYSLERYLNSNVQKQFEPGSSFKAITMAAALDTGSVTPDTTYTDTGVLEVGGYKIRNYNDESNGVQTMRQVLDKSLNTGAAFAQRRTGNDKFLNYVVGFGFSQKTGIDLAGEISGNISNLYQNRQVNFSTASFGQGIAVTPLQLINAYSAIANGGKLMRPYVVKEIVYADGTRKQTLPKIIGTPIREQTAGTLTAMLVDVVDHGFDQGRVSGYDVAGKTGTAQIPDKVNGGYLEDNQYIHDFVGFAPAYAPRFVILLKMVRPQGIKFASRSLSPVFSDIAEYLLRYFKIPPTR